ncbi:hypothetical protein AB205_0193510 [Aquarana catesbeiana]|uniref:Uncharacterized protein n=1 Tax=Aquarana catesbeiana TaxID=8400 RepID=A0A2G9RLX7_AQUCT|nr:hypothetical protein AB205_0193510 [Aquarana catesbeiana]
MTELLLKTKTTDIQTVSTQYGNTDNTHNNFARFTLKKSTQHGHDVDHRGACGGAGDRVTTQEHHWEAVVTPEQEATDQKFSWQDHQVFLNESCKVEKIKN